MKHFDVRHKDHTVRYEYNGSKLVNVFNLDLVSATSPLYLGQMVLDGEEIPNKFIALKDNKKGDKATVYLVSTEKKNFSIYETDVMFFLQQDTGIYFKKNDKVMSLSDYINSINVWDLIQ